MTSQIELFAFTDLNVSPGQSDTIERDGFTLRATIYADDDAAEPWKGEDGHGKVVTSSLPRGPRQGERELSDGQFYRFDDAVKIAKRDAWGVEGGREEGESLDDYAHRAALADFERLRAWARDEWSYVGVAVTVAKDGVILTGQYDHALWTLESDCPEHISAEANDLIDAALDAARAKLQSMAPVTQSEPAALAAPSVVWVVVIDHRHGTDVYAAATEDAAWKVAAEFARTSWAERFRETDAPADDREAVSQYFEDHDNEWRIIERVTVQGAADQGKA